MFYLKSNVAGVPFILDNLPETIDHPIIRVRSSAFAGLQLSASVNPQVRLLLCISEYPHSGLDDI